MGFKGIFEYVKFPFFYVTKNAESIRIRKMLLSSLMGIAISCHLKWCFYQENQASPHPSVLYYFLAAEMKNCTLILFLEHFNQKMALQSAYFLKNISLTHISVFWVIVHASTF